MLVFFVTMICSALITGLIIYTEKYHKHISHDHDLEGIQKYHTVSTPRIGGLAIFISFALVVLVTRQFDFHDDYDLGVLLSAIIVFIAGITEDITKKVSPFMRMNAFIVSSLIAIYATSSLPVITYADFGPLEHLIVRYHFVGVVLSLYCVVGLTNAYNIIDGYNGLSSTTAMVNMIALAIVSFFVGEPDVTRVSLYFVAAIFGFWIFNYPRGKIFLGDGGAYLIGFVIAVLSVYLIHVHKAAVSPYAVLLINIYPITEIGFSIYRRKIIHKTKGMQPDNMHLHQLIYHRCVPFTSTNRNAKVLPVMLFFIVPQVILAIMFYKHSLICLLCILFYILFYILSFFRLVKFKTYKFLKFML